MNNKKIAKLSYPLCFYRSATKLNPCKYIYKKKQDEDICLLIRSNFTKALSQLLLYWSWGQSRHGYGYVEPRMRNLFKESLE